VHYAPVSPAEEEVARPVMLYRALRSSEAMTAI
jgi:hypothetical protein